MPVRLSWDSQDAIPEGLKDFTVEREGEWHFEAETAEEVANLKKALKTERDARTKYEPVAKKAEKFQALLDADDDEAADFIQAWQSRDRAKDKPEGAPEATKQLELNEKLHAKEKKNLETRIAELEGELGKSQSELREFRLWTPLREIALKHGLNAEDWDLAKLDLSDQRRFDFDEEGKIIVIEDGGPSAVTPDRYFKEVYSDLRPKFYRATGAGGSGAMKGDPKFKSHKDYSNLPAAEKIKMARQMARKGA